MSHTQLKNHADRDALEGLEESFLAPWAIHAGNSRGRRISENEHPWRTCFQRDRDRVIHSSAFRRLEYKTQVFVNTEGDYYRTRLTHTLETAQIARTLARSLRLNEDLVEAAALSHDLGHTPFGHAGQEIMDELMSGHGGFEHNLQSLRIVDVLEKRYPDFPGLNLCEETREAIAKHSPKEILGFREGWPSLEGQLVDVVDSVAYLAADLDDGLHSHILNIENLQSLELVQEAVKRITKKIGPLDYRVYRRPLISELINILTTDLLAHTRGQLEKMSIRTPDDVRCAQHPIVGFSEEISRYKARTHVYLNKQFYSHYRVRRMAVRAQEILTRLFNLFVANPDILPPEHQKNCDQYGVQRAVCDYVAGMTDRFAIDEIARLNFPMRF